MTSIVISRNGLSLICWKKLDFNFKKGKSTFTTTKMGCNLLV
jgi:hypothetical protein